MRPSKTANRNSGFRNGFLIDLPFFTRNQPIVASQFSHRKPSFNWWTVLTRFASKSVGSGLGPGSRNCPLAEKREHQTFAAAKN